MNLVDVAALLEILRQHACYISDGDEMDIEESIALWSVGDETADLANLSVRTCRCGVRIEGFDGFTEHLEREVRKLSGVTT